MQLLIILKDQQQKKNPLHCILLYFRGLLQQPHIHLPEILHLFMRANKAYSL